MKKIHALLFMIIGIFVGVLGYQALFPQHQPQVISTAFNHEMSMYRNYLHNIWAERVKHAADSLVKKGHLEFQHIPDSVNMIRIKTENMIHFIQKIDSGLHSIKGILDPKTGEVKNVFETKKTYQYFMGEEPAANKGKGNGAAKFFFDSLYAYSQKLTLAVNTYRKEREQISACVNQRESNPSFEESYFKDATYLEARNTLFRFRENIYDFEEKLLFIYALRLGIEKVKKPEEEKKESRLPRDCGNCMLPLSEEQYYNFLHINRW